MFQVHQPVLALTRRFCLWFCHDERDITAQRLEAIKENASVTVRPTSAPLHWNYFLALEKDLEGVSRYIEFCGPNLQTFSIELAHLLFASASEVDTLAKCICQILDPKAKCETIDDYRRIIKAGEEGEIYPTGQKLKPEHQHRLSSLKVHIPRYNLEFTPWESWAKDTNPDWWRAYNRVKHQRDTFFNEATLCNAIYALSALLAMNYLYCRLKIAEQGEGLRFRFEHKGPGVTRHLQPQSTFMRLPREYYDDIRRDLASIAQSVPSKADIRALVEDSR